MSPTQTNFLQYLVSILSVIPQYKWLQEKESNFQEEYSKCVSRYLEIFRNFSTMTQDEITSIDAAIKKYRDIAKSRNSASGNSLPRIWKLIGDRRTEFVSNIESIMIPKDEFTYKEFEIQASKTAEMMANAYKINTEGGESGYNFHDGDPLSDTVRWTYLRVQPYEEMGTETYLHYFVSHFYDQIAMSWIKSNFSAEELESAGIDLKKDGALAIITDSLSYLNATNRMTPGIKNILHYWLTDRSVGGLSWIMQLRLDVFSKHYRSDK